MCSDLIVGRREKKGKKVCLVVEEGRGGEGGVVWVGVKMAFSLGTPIGAKWLFLRFPIWGENWENLVDLMKKLNYSSALIS